MLNFKKLPAMKKEIARAEDKIKSYEKQVEKIKNDNEIEEKIKELMIENLKYYMNKELKIETEEIKFKNNWCFIKLITSLWAWVKY